MSFDVRERAGGRGRHEIPACRIFSVIDILVNNAGNAHGLDPIDEGNADDWEAMLDINVKGLLYISRAVLPGMVKRKAGTYYQYWLHGREGGISSRECVLRE